MPLSDLKAFNDSIEALRSPAYSPRRQGQPVAESTQGTQGLDLFREQVAQEDLRRQQIKEVTAAVKTTTGRDISPERAAQLAPGYYSPDTGPNMLNPAAWEQEYKYAKTDPVGAARSYVAAGMRGATFQRFLPLTKWAESRGLLAPGTSQDIESRLEDPRFQIGRTISEFGGEMGPIVGLEAIAGRPLVKKLAGRLAVPTTKLGKVGRAAATAGTSAGLTGAGYEALQPDPTLGKVVSGAVQWGLLGAVAGGLGGALPERVPRGPFQETPGTTPEPPVTPQATPTPAPAIPAVEPGPVAPPVKFAPQREVPRPRRAGEMTVDMLPDQTPAFDREALLRDRAAAQQVIDNPAFAQKTKREAADVIAQIDRELAQAPVEAPPVVSRETPLTPEPVPSPEGGAGLERRGPVEERRLAQQAVPAERRVVPERRQTALAEAAGIVGGTAEGQAAGAASTRQAMKDVAKVQGVKPRQVPMEQRALNWEKEQGEKARLAGEKPKPALPAVPEQVPVEKMRNVELTSEAQRLGLQEDAGTLTAGDVARRDAIEAELGRRRVAGKEQAKNVAAQPVERKPIGPPERKAAVEAEISAEIKAANEAKANPPRPGDRVRIKGGRYAGQEGVLENPIRRRPSTTGKGSMAQPQPAENRILLPNGKRVLAGTVEKIGEAPPPKAVFNTALKGAEEAQREGAWQRLMSAKPEDAKSLVAGMRNEEAQGFLDRLNAAPGDNPVARAALEAKLKAPTAAQPAQPAVNKPGRRPVTREDMQAENLRRETERAATHAQYPELVKMADDLGMTLDTPYVGPKKTLWNFTEKTGTITRSGHPASISISEPTPEKLMEAIKNKWEEFRAAGQGQEAVNPWWQKGEVAKPGTAVPGQPTVKTPIVRFSEKEVRDLEALGRTREELAAKYGAEALPPPPAPRTKLADLQPGDNVHATLSGKFKGTVVVGARKGQKAAVLGDQVVKKVNDKSVIFENVKNGEQIRVPKSKTSAWGKVETPDVKRLTPEQVAERERLRKAGNDRAGANDIVEMHSGFNPIQAVRNASEAIPPEAKNVIVQARKMLKTEPGKKLARILEKFVDPNQSRRAGTMFEKFRQIGFNDPKREAFIRGGGLADVLEGKALPAQGDFLAKHVSDLLTEMWVEARAKGVRVAGFVKGYFPRMWKREIAEVVFDDMVSAERKQALLQEIGANTVDANKIIERLANSGELHEKTKSAILHLISTKQAKNWSEAWQMIRRQAAEDLFEPFGNIEKRRIAEFPADFYDRDAGRVLGQYVNSWAKRVSQVEAFGPKSEKANALLKAIRAENPAEAHTARQIIDTFTGKLEKEERLSRGMEKFWRRFTGAEVTTKIGLGYATLKNVFQTLISTSHDAGFIRAMKGIARVSQGGAEGAAARSQVRRSGALKNLAWEALTGYRPLSKSGEISEAVLKGSGFHGINVANQYAAASTGKVFMQDLHKIARGEGALNQIPWVKGSRMRWAQNKLREYGIRWDKPLTEKAVLRGMYRFATDTQLQKNILRDPLLANNPKWRPFYLFKRFGLRQFNYIKDTMSENFKQAGGGTAGFAASAVPMFRLLAGGVAGGAVSMQAQEAIGHLLSGEPPRPKDRDLLDYGIDALASIGSWSIISDIVGAENKLKSVGFFVTPIQAQELATAWEGLSQLWHDMDVDAALSIPPKKPIPVRPVPEILQRQIKPVAKFFGSWPREASRRFATPEQSKDRIANLKGQVRDDIFRAIFRKDVEGAKRLRKNWNGSYPKSPITYEDVSPEELYRWKVRRGISKPANPDVTQGPQTNPMQSAPMGPATP